MKTIPVAMIAAVVAFPVLAAPDVAVRMGAFPEGETPAFTQGAVVDVAVSNASGRAISEEVALRVTRWDGKTAILAAAVTNAAGDGGSPAFFPGEVRRFSLPTADLAPDGYVHTVVSAAVNQVYAAYIAEAKKSGPESKILFGNNYPWPNFYAHVIWPQWRSHDIISLDLQYVCGFEKTLGTNEEMIDILEGAESIGKRFGKPVWGREVYVQPRYPGEVAALQNWAMVAHGVDVALVFAWKPFADWGRDIFKTGPRTWEKPESPPMWFLIDTDGTRLPAYEAVKRSAAEIAGFHANVDARQLRRIPGETALFWAEDTSVKIVYDTFDRPWETRLATDRTAITAGLRYRGARVEFLDDAMLGELAPEHHPVCVVPPAPVVSDAALAALRAYAAGGGRLVLFVPFNTLDVNLRPKAEEEIGIAGWKGDILAIGDFPGRYDAEPHEPEAYARWFDGFVGKAGIPRSAWWENASAMTASGQRQSGPGKGPPVVEIVVRRHARTGRRYAFVLNKGGSGSGASADPISRARHSVTPLPVRAFHPTSPFPPSATAFLRYCSGMGDMEWGTGPGSHLRLRLAVRENLPRLPVCVEYGILGHIHWNGAFGSIPWDPGTSGNPRSTSPGCATCVRSPCSTRRDTWAASPGKRNKT